MEHYEIATYGGLVQLALTMQLETGSLLTDIAENDINIEAEQEGEYVWEKEATEKNVIASAFRHAGLLSMLFIFRCNITIS